MVDDDGHAVIIDFCDFDSCTTIGAVEQGGRLGGRHAPKQSRSRTMNTVDLVARFIRGEYDGQDLPISISLYYKYFWHRLISIPAILTMCILCRSPL